MNPRQFATLTALCRTEVLPACVLILLATLGLAATRTTAAPPILDRVAPALAANVAPTLTEKPAFATAKAADAPLVADSSADGNPDVVIAGTAMAGPAATPAASPEPKPVEAANPVETRPDETKPDETKPDSRPIVVASLGDPAAKLPDEPAPAPAATAAPQEATSGAEPSLNSVEIFDECRDPDVCIDRYLWALYQRTPKEDAIRVQEQTKVTVKRKGKLVTVTRTSSRVVDEDFAWKDPKAAENAKMSMMDYVIGGMDRSFKLKLFHALRAAEQAGLRPGITSAFRDDYRQSIASGLKAATDRSYHGGSFRGGYGHGLAADVVSVNGATRAQRQASSEILWKWIDTHAQEIGIGRPYLDRDPPHVGPIDGKEYADHRGAKPQKQEAKSTAEKRKRVVARDDRSGTKRARGAKS